MISSWRKNCQNAAAPHDLFWSISTAFHPLEWASAAMVCPLFQSEPGVSSPLSARKPWPARNRLEWSSEDCFEQVAFDAGIVVASLSRASMGRRRWKC